MITIRLNDDEARALKTLCLARRDRVVAIQRGATGPEIDSVLAKLAAAQAEAEPSLVSPVIDFRAVGTTPRPNLTRNLKHASSK